jgi:NAD-dependent deacetylase
MVDTKPVYQAGRVLFRLAVGPPAREPLRKPPFLVGISTRGGGAAPPGTLGCYGPAVREIDELARRWSQAERVVVLTGAGLSTASGIPDFRSPGGRWSSYQPVLIQDFVASESAREEYWRYKGETWQVIQQAEPNPAHLALADFARAGAVGLLATQNVDGLHERSGFPADRLVNVHGTDSTVTCLDCGAREPRAHAQRLWESGAAVPRCACGGAWKPATISFGQSLVPEDLERAMGEASRCDLFVAAGTSLVVSPINQMFDLAHAAGATMAILTASETPCDALCEIRLRDPVEQVLPALFSASGLG